MANSGEEAKASSTSSFGKTAVRQGLSAVIYEGYPLS